MTTAFEIASTTAYELWNINQVVEAYAVYSAHSRISAARVAPSTHAPVTRIDTADFSGTSTVVAAAFSDEQLQLDRIATLRQSIADGTYNISASTLADSILKSGLNGW